MGHRINSALGKLFLLVVGYFSDSLCLGVAFPLEKAAKCNTGGFLAGFVLYVF